MSVIAAQNGNAIQSSAQPAMQVTSYQVQANNGAVGTVTNSSDSTTIAIFNNSNPVSTSTTINIPSIQSGSTVTGGSGGSVQNTVPWLTNPLLGSGGGGGGGGTTYPPYQIYQPGGTGGAGGTLGQWMGGGVSTYTPWEPRKVTEDEMKNLIEYFSTLLSGMVLIDNETKNTKEVKPMQEGFDLFHKYKTVGDKVTVTMLNSDAAKVLYGKKV